MDMTMRSVNWAEVQRIWTKLLQPRVFDYDEARDNQDKAAQNEISEIIPSEFTQAKQTKEEDQSQNEDDKVALTTKPDDIRPTKPKKAEVTGPAGKSASASKKTVSPKEEQGVSGKASVRNTKDGANDNQHKHDTSTSGSSAQTALEPGVIEDQQKLLVQTSYPVSEVESGALLPPQIETAKTAEPEKYVLRIHHDFHLDEDGQVDSTIGHFYVEFVGPEIEKDEAFFGQNPTIKDFPIALGKIENEKKRYYEASEAKISKSKEIKLTKEQFEAAYNQAKNRMANPQLYFDHLGDDCIDFVQQIYRAAGQVSDFVDHYTVEGIKQLESWAGWSARDRFGAGDEPFNIAGISKEAAAKKYNVPLDRVTAPNLPPVGCSDECLSGFTIKPVKPK